MLQLERLFTGRSGSNMASNVSLIAFLGTVFIISLAFPWAVHSDPIKIDFGACQPAVYTIPASNNTQNFTIKCCPPVPKRVIDGLPPPMSPTVRVRMATQCTDAAYAKKLQKAYALMRALPDDDPRSFVQQWRLHCSYCGAAFLTRNSSNIPQGVDVHWSWFFYPWHRFFIYFHERILQSLLNDPTFSLSFWNWDNPFNTSGWGDGGGGCLKAGDSFPTAYAPISASTYDGNRSRYAKGLERLKFPDLGFSFQVPAARQPIANYTEQQLYASNINIMYNGMVSVGRTPQTFLGLPYRAGNVKGAPGPSTAGGGGGLLEATAHLSVHSWIGQDPPVGLDMGSLAYAARDPVFFAHHSNIDRLFWLWREIGPLVGQVRQYYNDPDFLNAEFIFYDENKEARRVKIRDGLNTTQLGYVYQPVNDLVWIYPNRTRCSSVPNQNTIAAARRLPAPIKKSDGLYHLEDGESITMLVDMPATKVGTEVFVDIAGIKMDRSQNAGFDVFMNLLNPKEYSTPYACSEYLGRFANMAQGTHEFEGHKTFQWRQSVDQAVSSIQTASSPSTVAITLVPMSATQNTIKFASITINY